MIWSFLFTALIAAGGLACTSTGGGGSGDAGAGGVPANALDGLWASSTFTFSVDSSHITAFEFLGLGCDGAEVAPGLSLCTSRLAGPVTTQATIEANGHFQWDGGFGLAIEGVLDADTGAAGTFTYTADNGCCTAEGSWEATHGAGGSNPNDEPCHEEETGSEELSIGLSTTNGYLALEPGAAIEAVPGIQGAIMVTAALRVRGMSMGGVRAQIEIEVPSAQVSGSVVTIINPFAMEPDGTAWTWYDIWVVLQDETGEMLSPVDPADVALIDGAPAVLRARIDNDCGFSLASEVAGSLDYGSAL